MVSVFTAALPNIVVPDEIAIGGVGDSKISLILVPLINHATYVDPLNKQKKLASIAPSGTC